MIGSSNALATKFDVLGERTDNPSGTVVWSGITTEIISKYQYIGVEHQYYDWNTSTGDVFWDYVPVYSLLNWTNHNKCTGHASNEWVSIWIANGVLNSTGSYEKIKRIVGIVGGGGITGTTNQSPVASMTPLWTGSITSTQTITLSSSYQNHQFIYFEGRNGGTSADRVLFRVPTSWFSQRSNTSGNQYTVTGNFFLSPLSATSIRVGLSSATLTGVYGASI